MLSDKLAQMIEPRSLLSTRLRLLLAFLPVYAVFLASPLMPREAGSSDQDDVTYREFVKRAGGGDLSIDFRQFRLACLKASDCDPRGDSKDVVSVRRAMQAKEYDKAVKTAETMIEHGFVNIEAHVLCAEAYTALNNPEKAKLHHDVAAGLIRSILATGDGKTKATAFEVIGTFEEYVVMRVLGLLPPLPSQALISDKKHSYDVLTVDDPKTGRKVSVFFNIDLFFPMKGL